MNPLLRLTAAATSLASLFPPGVKAADPVPAKPLAITEVHTWGDLLAQKPIPLTSSGVANPGKSAPPACRVGVDLTYARLYGAAILYCISDTNDGDTGTDVFGPLSLDVENSAQPRKEREIAEISRGGTAVEGGEHHHYFFIKIIPFNAPGDYPITLRRHNPSSPSLATAVVKITKDNTAPLWSPWGSSKKAGDDIDTDRSWLVNVANPSTGIALPGWNRGPLTLEQLPDPKLPLPWLISADPDPAMRLDIQGNFLTVKFDKAVIASDPLDYIFLTRWWVNGKPFIPKLKPDELMTSMAIEWQAAWVAEVRFLVDFHPEILGAKKGDVIAMQLLFCTDGWTETRPPNPDAAVQDLPLIPNDNTAPIAISRLSNRIEFTYTGDPTAFAPVK